MQVKSARGVQQHDVQEAADALIAEGLRPTIERVRQKIGRGSPNTVSPMLDKWFSGLAKRLDVAGGDKESTAPPEPVQLAAAMLWETAMQSAQHKAEQDFLQVRQLLSNERLELERRETELEEHQQTLNTRQIALDETLQLARSQIFRMTSQLEDAAALQKRRDQEMEELRKKLLIRENERDAELQRNNEQFSRHSQERLQIGARAMANERRLMLELDRKRQEIKNLIATHTELEHRTQSDYKHLQATNTSLTEKLQDTEQALSYAELAAATTNTRISELQKLLKTYEQASATNKLGLINQQGKGFLRKPLKQLIRISPKRKRL